MKKLIALLLLCLSLSPLKAQNFKLDSLNINYWELGWVATDIFTGALTLDFAIGISDNQAIGIRSTLTNDYFLYNYNGVYSGSNYMYRGGLFHKIYIPSKRNRKITLRHGPHIRISEYSSQKEEWVEFNRFGNSQYRLTTIDLEDQNIELGYELLLGLQQRNNSIFFLEYYAGIRYLELVSTNSELYSLSELKELNSYGDGDVFDFYPNNISLVVGLVIGLQK